MYIHQVMSSILDIAERFEKDHSFKELTPMELTKHTEDTVSNLMECVSYHFEDIEKIQELTNKLRKGLRPAGPLCMSIIF